MCIRDRFYDRLDIAGTDYEITYTHVIKKCSDWLYENGIDEYFGLAVQELKEILNRIKQARLNIPFSLSMTTNIIFSALIDADHFAVSYTHLDVYKRQSIYD